MAHGLRRAARWVGRRAALAAAGWAVASLTGCGGGGGGGGGGDTTPPTVIAVKFVGPDGVDVGAISPSFVPRNAWIELTFGAAIDPATLHDPALSVREGPFFETPTLGTFRRVDPYHVLFDPTSFGNGGARPLGFDASSPHRISMPSGVPSGDMVRSTGGTAPAFGFQLDFTTTDAFVHDATPPRVVGLRVSPLPSGADGGKLASASTFEVDFDEPMDARSMQLSLGRTGPGPGDGFDLRYEADGAENQASSVTNRPIPAVVTLSANAKTARIVPLYPLGDREVTFHLHALGGLRDLAGNPLVPGVVLGTFTCRGDGAAPPPQVLAETFASSADQDVAASEVGWGGGLLEAPPVTTRRVYVRGCDAVNVDIGLGIPGIRLVSPVPLIGADLDAVAPQTPPASQGRRMLLRFDAAELGPRGTILAAGWGPDRNATFQASYPFVSIRLGHGDATATLSPFFQDNFVEPATVVYAGGYTVAQRLNVGNEAPVVAPAIVGTVFQPLFDHTGFVPWPAFQTPFPWDPQGPTNDPARSLLFEVAAQPGTTWQDMRAYFRGPAVALLTAPARRIVAAFADGVANPPGTIVTPNPDPVIQDTAFTIATNRTTVQSRFWTPDATDEDGHAYPDPLSAGPRTLGTRSDYGPAALVAPSLPTGTSVVLEFQGAMALDPAYPDRTRPDVGQPVTPWTSDPDDCDGYPYLRWRATLIANPTTGARPVVDAVLVPIARKP